MITIQSLRALEILDSRGRPTVKVWCTLDSGVTASASAPSGASTGTAEALELRDRDMMRYQGLGCRKAVANIEGPILTALKDRPFPGQEELDQALIQLDGTPNKSRLGANAILATSLACARAEAASLAIPLYRHFANLLGTSAATLPRTTINLFSGGKHAGGQVAIQDVLVVPASARTIDESLAMTYAIYQSAAALTSKKYQARALKADEGGLAPPFPNTEAMLADAVEAIAAAGFEPGRDAMLAVDIASSHFYENGSYHLDGKALTGTQMIDQLTKWVETYPIISVEDGLAEEDWEHWPALCRALSDRALVLGDDFLCTNPGRLRRAIQGCCATALLLKVNQIGTLSEAMEACRLARQAGWKVTVSARSGETEDDWLADLATAWGDQIKVGSINQSERLAKYNRLLEIEAESHFPLVAWPR